MNKPAEINASPPAATRQHILIALLLLCAVWALYANTLQNEFVYDDLYLIENNDGVKSFSSVKHLFDSGYYQISGERTWRPLCTFSFIADNALWHGDARGFRVTNLALHSATVLALYWLAAGLLGTPWLAFLAALLFAVHPLASEAVNGISFREDILSAFFFIMALAFYVRQRRRADTVSFSSAAFLSLLYALGLMSKENAILLPAALLLYDWYSEKNQTLLGAFRRAAPAQALLILTAAAYLAVRFVVLRNPAGENPYPAAPFEMIGAMSWVFMRNLAMFVSPTRLCLDYFVSPISLFSLFGSACAAAALLLLGLSIASRRHLPAFGFGFALFVLGFLPVSNIIPIGAWMADRYVYLPLAGLAVAGIALAQWFFERPWVSGGRRAVRMLPVFLIGGILLLAGLTFEHNVVWRDGLTLWQDTVRCCPRSSRAHAMFGRELYYRRLLEDAETHLRKAIEMDANHAEAHIALGLVYRDTERPQASERAFQSALRINPKNEYALFYLGQTHMRMGNLKKALDYSQQAHALSRQWRDPLLQIGVILSLMGKNERAIQYFKEVLRTHGGDVETHGRLGFALLNLRRLDEAGKHFQFALRHAPDDPVGHSGMGFILFFRGRYDAAEKHIRFALDRSPNDRNSQQLLQIIRRLKFQRGPVK